MTTDFFSIHLEIWYKIGNNLKYWDRENFRITCKIMQELINTLISKANIDEATAVKVIDVVKN